LSIWVAATAEEIFDLTGTLVIQQRSCPGEGPVLADEKIGAGYWRSLAIEARKAAEHLHDPNSVRIILRIAEAYDSLAERSEKHEDIEKGHSK